ncbi:MAG: 1-(5-phosphoribosyl)-5-[(5-phosphoribosylamino)methylideneamino]imidazole-4-carboxamide isomerase [Chitinophagaceae bacterium]
MLIIPAIDIIDGKCVRLTEGNYAEKTVYNNQPLEVAKMFEDAGLKRLHLVDLDGAKAGKVVNWAVLETIAAKTSLIIDFGGGIKQEKDVEIVWNSGATYATIGSLAVKNEVLFSDWIQKFGANKFMLGADVKNQLIAINGWLDTTDIDVFSFIQQYTNKGIKQLFCTDVSKDGKLQGPSTDLYKTIIEQFPQLFFIASGGVANINDVHALAEIGCKGAIIGKAIYEGKISLKELQDFQLKQKSV